MSADIVKIRDYQGVLVNYGVRHEEPASVIILPVVRIERNPSDLADIKPGRQRRRPSPRVD